MKRFYSSRFLLWAVSLYTGILLAFILPAAAQDVGGPIIDMHLHAKRADELGPPPLYLCAPFSIWPVKDTQEDPQVYFARVQNKPACNSPLRSGSNDEDLMQRTLAILKSRNVTVAVTDGSLDVMEKWKQAAEGRILPALPFDPESGKPSIEELRQLVKSKRVMAFAEISSQYEGIAVTDPRMEPILRSRKNSIFRWAFTWVLGRRERLTSLRLTTGCGSPAC